MISLSENYMISFPVKKYNIIYADPPWSYYNKKTGGSFNSGASQKYPTMSIDEICDLPIDTITDNDAILFLWSTTPLLPESLTVMKSWGFRYKTKIIWKKPSIGLGYWFRTQTEDLLVGIKGNIKPFYCQHSNFIESRRLKHSVKPHEFRLLIEKATINIPNARRIELFARTENPGWDSWGLEVN